MSLNRRLLLATAPHQFHQCRTLLRIDGRELSSSAHVHESSRNLPACAVVAVIFLLVIAAGFALVFLAASLRGYWEAQ